MSVLAAEEGSSNFNSTLSLAIREKLAINIDLDVLCDSQVSVDPNGIIDLGVDFSRDIRDIKRIAMASLAFVENQSLKTPPELVFLSSEGSECPLFEKVRPMICDEPVLAVLLLSSSIELMVRKIHTVVVSPRNKERILLSESNVRAMLEDARMRPIMGESLLNLLNEVMCTPSGLNIRNLCWHGYACDSDIHPCWPSLLITIGITLSHKVRTEGIFEFTEGQIFEERTPAKCPSHTGKTMPCDELFIYGELLSNSLRTLPDEDGMILSWWSKASDLYEEEEYFPCVCYMLVILERKLRRVYVEANELPRDFLEARGGVYYHTIDMMIGPTVTFNPSPTYKYDFNSPRNRILDILSHSTIAFLHDLFVYSSGPRLRDKFGHGFLRSDEVNDGPMSRDILLAMFSVFTDVKYHFSKENAPTIIYTTEFHNKKVLLKSVLGVLDEIKNLVLLLENDHQVEEIIGEWLISLEKLVALAWDAMETVQTDFRVKEECIIFDRLIEACEVCVVVVKVTNSKFTTLRERVQSELASNRQENSYLALRTHYLGQIVDLVSGFSEIAIKLAASKSFNAEPAATQEFIVINRKKIDTGVNTLLSSLQNAQKSFLGDTQRILNKSEESLGRAKRVLEGIGCLI